VNIVSEDEIILDILEGEMVGYKARQWCREGKLTDNPTV